MLYFRHILERLKHQPAKSEADRQQKSLQLRRIQQFWSKAKKRLGTVRCDADKLKEKQSQKVLRWELFNRYRVLVLQDEKSSGNGWCDHSTVTWMNLMPLNCILKNARLARLLDASLWLFFLFFTPMPDCKLHLYDPRGPSWSRGTALEVWAYCVLPLPGWQLKPSFYFLKKKKIARMAN